jgi:anti-anti-sigma factor
MAEDTTNSRIPVVEVIVREELDLTAVPRLNATLAQALEWHPTELVVDLAECPRINAAAIGVLLDAHRQAHVSGGRLTLRAPSDPVRRNLRLARADRVLRVAPVDGTAGSRPCHTAPTDA